MIRILSTALLGMMGKRIPWGAGHHDAYGQLSDRIMAIAAVCEDLPEETNSVTLDQAMTDSSGIQAAKIEYRISDNSRRMMAFAAERGRELFTAAGAAEILRTQTPLPIAGWHNLGTARMGNDPDTSVVNAWGGRPHPSVDPRESTLTFWRAHEIFCVGGIVFSRRIG